MQRTKISDEMIDNIISLHKQGKRDAEIAKLVGCSYATVGRYKKGNRKKSGNAVVVKSTHTDVISLKSMNTKLFEENERLRAENDRLNIALNKYAKDNRALRNALESARLSIEVAFDISDTTPTIIM